MKKLTLSVLACFAVAASAVAGVATSGKSYKEYKGDVEETCFNDQELQLDLFGSHTWQNGSGYDDGFGGGIGVNYFFMRYVGIGVDGNVYDGGVHGLWNVSSSLIVRFPIDSVCLAPYILAGGGVQTDGKTVGTWHAGGGLEYRVVPHKIGLFAEGRYIWGADDDESAQARLGVRVVF